MPGSSRWLQMGHFIWDHLSEICIALHGFKVKPITEHGITFGTGETDGDPIKTINPVLGRERIIIGDAFLQKVIRALG